MSETQHYHHGDLRRAALDAALTAARAGGPRAISLTAIAKQHAVTVPALYRHFDGREELVGAVAMLAQAELAKFIERRRPPDWRGAALLRGVGLSYIDFALAEPGWFETAFTVPPDLDRAGDPAAAGPAGRTPFQLLSEALDDLVAEGELPRDARPGAEIPCWSAVHGFAELAVHGPLRRLPATTATLLAARTVDVAIQGLLAAAAEARSK